MEFLMIAGKQVAFRTRYLPETYLHTLLYTDT